MVEPVSFEISNPFEIIKSLIIYNIGIRYNDFLNNPKFNSIDNINELPIYIINHTRYELLLSLIYNTNNIEDILHNKNFIPIFSKGKNRLESFYYFLQGKLKIYDNQSVNINWWNTTNEYHKSIYIAHFIVINQIFSDANHRTSMYYLKNYFNKVDIQVDDTTINNNIKEIILMNERTRSLFHDFPDNTTSAIKYWINIYLQINKILKI